MFSITKEKILCVKKACKFSRGNDNAAFTVPLHVQRTKTGCDGAGGGGGESVTLLPEKKYTMPESMCCTNALKSQKNKNVHNSYV